MCFALVLCGVYDVFSTERMSEMLTLEKQLEITKHIRDGWSMPHVTEHNKISNLQNNKIVKNKLKTYIHNLCGEVFEKQCEECHIKACGPILVWHSSHARQMLPLKNHSCISSAYFYICITLKTFNISVVYHDMWHGSAFFDMLWNQQLWVQGCKFHRRVKTYYW